MSSQAPFDLLLGVPIDCSGAFVGCQRMPSALRAADIAGALGIRDDGGNLQVTIADPVRDPDTGVIGLRDVVAASEVVRSTLTDLLTKGRRPLLLGGDCTVLIGVAAALRRRRSRAGLMFLDGHLDCYDGASSRTDECADMELAVLLGVGPEPLVRFDGDPPLLEHRRVVALGASDESRAARDGAPDPRQFAPRMRIVPFEDLAGDPGGHARNAIEHLHRTSGGFWLHVDLDVLSCAEFPAVGYPSSEGLSWEQLLEILGPPFADERLLGASVVILNPTKDPDGRYAKRLVGVLRQAAMWVE